MTHRQSLCFSLILFGCGPDAADICETDPYGCSQDTGNFSPISEGCPSAPLAVEVGYGQNAFTAFEPSDDLSVVFGPQGGSHAWLAISASNVAIDVTDKLKTFLRVWVENEPGCMRESQDDEAPGCRTLRSSRNVLLGDGKALNVIQDEASTDGQPRLVRVTESGLLIFSSPVGDSGSIEATIEDECGRTAKAIHWVGLAGPTQ